VRPDDGVACSGGAEVLRCAAAATLLAFVRQYRVKPPASIDPLRLLQADKDMIAGLADDTPLDAKVTGAIDRLWKDPGIRQTYDNRARFQLNDSADL